MRTSVSFGLIPRTMYGTPPEVRLFRERAAALERFVERGAFAGFNASGCSSSAITGGVIVSLTGGAGGAIESTL